jgi:hypothetical protein
MTTLPAGPSPTQLAIGHLNSSGGARSDTRPTRGANAPRMLAM